MSNAAKIVKKNIELLLKKNRMTKTGLARAIGTMPSTMTRLLTEENEDFKLSLLEKIAQCFKIKIDSLLDEHLQLFHEKLPSITMLSAPFLNWDYMRHYIKGQKIEKPMANDIDSRTWTFFEIGEDHMHISDNIFALVSQPSMYPLIPRESNLIFDPARTPKDGQYGLIRIRKTGDVALKVFSVDAPNTWFKSISSQDKTLLNDEEHEVLATLITTTYSKGII